MPSVRCTAFFRDDDGHGWSETHDRDGGVTPDVAGIIAQFDALMIASRRPLLAADAYYLGCRVSYPTINHETAGDNLYKDPPVQGPQTYQNNPLFMNLASDAVKMRLRNGAATAKTDVYLRGVWDEVISAGVLNFATVVGAEFKRRLDAYVAALVAGAYGWVGRSPATTSRGDVTGYIANPDGKVTLNLTPKNGVALPAAGTRVTVTFARLNHSNSILNRSWVAKVDAGGASVTTIQVIAVGDFVSEGTYIMPQKALIPYAAVSYYKASHRKTGVPFGLERGRLPTRAVS